MSTINLTSIDPNTFKDSFRQYLKDQTVFKDYNFDDSNIDQLLTVLGHNTYLNSYYKNMIFSESILAKAQLRSSVVAKANELNYLPQSRQSSVATVNIVINASNINTLDLPKGVQFSGKIGLNTYTFTNDKSYISKSPIGNFYFNNVLIYEGSYLSDTYIVDNTIENQDFIISNSDVDISSISVFVIENNGSTTTEFTRRNNTFGLTPDSQIYFIEGYQDTKYRIVFGDDVLGRYPNNSGVIIITYRTCTGINGADFISNFNLDEDIVTQQGGILNNIEITTINPSFGGGERESAESIKYNAPRFYASQDAAITDVDYKSLLMNQFNVFIKDVNVYGGEKATPKQYGKTIICIKPKYNDITPQFIKDNIFSFLKDYNVGSVIPIMVDADSFYLKVTASVEYNATDSQLYSTDIEKLVLKEIKKYSSNSLEHFNSNFRYSKFGTMIDNSDPSIISNNTDVVLCKRLYPKINTTQKFYIEIGNQILLDPNDPVVTSSKFSWIKDDVTTDNCFIADDSTGLLNVYAVNDQGKNILIEKKIGTVNYDGIVSIQSFNIASYIGPYVEVLVKLRNKNVVINGSKILYIDINDVDLNVIGVVND